jgi:hypothetical protein
VKRPKRNSRFDTVKQLYGMVKGGYATEEQAKAQFTYGNVVIFKSELEKFALENADINIEDFTQFATNTGALKTSGKGEGKGGNKPSLLISDEKIAAIQIAPENVEAYKAALTALLNAKTTINSLIQNKDYTCGYYITKSGKKAQA